MRSKYLRIIRWEKFRREGGNMVLKQYVDDMRYVKQISKYKVSLAYLKWQS